MSAGLFTVAPVPRTAWSLLASASEELAEAARTSQPARRFAAAHLAGLRAAAAVLAVRARPGRRSHRPANVWALLTAVAPELGEWPVFFASGSATRAAAEAGVTGLVSERDADDQVRQSAQFLEIVQRMVRGGGS